LFEKNFPNRFFWNEDSFLGQKTIVFNIDSKNDCYGRLNFNSINREIELKMEAHFQFLLCGYNGTGYSSLISIEKPMKEETKVFNRVLINVGEGTQRFCSENKIKLFTVSAIIITSLSPQNISGFPGVFLALSDLVNRTQSLLFT
jgi:hypothetical protein